MKTKKVRQGRTQTLYILRCFDATYSAGPTLKLVRLLAVRCNQNAMHETTGENKRPDTSLMVMYIENQRHVLCMIHNVIRTQFCPCQPTQLLGMILQILTSPLLRSSSLKLSSFVFLLSLPCSHALTFFLVPSHSETIPT